MQIVHHPHPALRFKSVEVTRIDDVLRAAVREMFELMYAAKGIGLAANQVGLPLRFFVTNLTGDAEQRDDEHVFINPVITNRRGSAVGEEGCLSLPTLYADVRRAEEITVEAFDLDGQGFRTRLDELAARVVQHETDHLDGVLFVDRLTESSRDELGLKLAELETEYRRAQREGQVPAEDIIRRELEETARRGYLSNAEGGARKAE
jgi:peptide deformylase